MSKSYESNEEDVAWKRADTGQQKSGQAPEKTVVKDGKTCTRCGWKNCKCAGSGGMSGGVIGGIGTGGV